MEDKPLPLVVFTNKDKILKLLSKKNKKEDIEDRRRYIYTFISSLMDNKVNRIDCWRNSDLKKAIRLYDELFLGGCISKLGYKGDKEFNSSFEELEGYNMVPGRVRINLEWNKLQLTIFKHLFRSSFEKNVSNTSRCYDRLECMLQTLEHELVHVVLDMYEEDLNKVDRNSLRVDPHSKLFGKYLSSIFGTNIIPNYLGLDIDLYEGLDEYIRDNIKVGDKVRIINRGIRTISNIGVNKDGETFVEIEEKEGERIPIEFVDIPNKKRIEANKNVLLSPISMKGTK